MLHGEMKAVTCRSTASQTRTHDWRKWTELKEWPDHVNKKPTMFNYLQSRNVYGVYISWSFQQSPPDLPKVFANNIHPKKSKTSHFLDFKGRILKLILDHLWSQLQMLTGSKMASKLYKTLHTHLHTCSPPSAMEIRPRGYVNNSQSGSVWSVDLVDLLYREPLSRRN